MGKRKRLAAENRKEALKTLYFAKLKGVPSSPRKMRYVVDMLFSRFNESFKFFFRA